MAARPLRLISTPLEVFSGPRESEATTSHNIPTRHPHVAAPSQPAIAAGCYTNDALVLISTPFADQCILELRTFSLDSPHANPAAQQLLFPAPILDSPHLNAASQSLTLQVCTTSGIVYRILLPLDLLGSVDEIPARWYSEHRIASLGSDPLDILRQGLLTSFHTSRDGLISMAACTDGRVIKVVWEEDGDTLDGLSGEWAIEVKGGAHLADGFFCRRLAGICSSSRILLLSTLQPDWLVRLAISSAVDVDVQSLRATKLHSRLHCYS